MMRTKTKKRMKTTTRRKMMKKKRRKKNRKKKKKRKKWKSDARRGAAPPPRPRLFSQEAHRQTQEPQDQLTGWRRSRDPLLLLPLRFLQQQQSWRGRLLWREQRPPPPTLLWGGAAKNSEILPWSSYPSQPTLLLPRQLSVHTAGPCCLGAVGRLSFRLQCQGVGHVPGVALPSPQVPPSAQSGRGFPGWVYRRLVEPRCCYQPAGHRCQPPSGTGDRI